MRLIFNLFILISLILFFSFQVASQYTTTCDDGKVSVHRTIISNPLSYFTWLENGKLIGKTLQKELVRSLDYGRNWIVESRKLLNYHVEQIFPTKNASMFYVLTKLSDQTRIFRSSDSGETYQSLPSFEKDSPYWIIVHPENPKYSLALGNKLYMTKDFGQTWIVGPSILGSSINWIKNYKNIEGATETALFLIQRNYPTDLYWTNDLLTLNLVANRVQSVEQVEDNFFVAKWIESNSYSLQLLVTKDLKNFKSVQFTSAEFGSKIDNHWIYTWLKKETSGDVLVSIAGNAAKNWGHVYKSSADGTKFNPIFYDVIREQFGVDFATSIGNIEGVYIANAWDEDVVNDQSDKVPVSTTDLSYAETQISFDAGSIWSYISPPKVDSLGKPYNCSGNDCYLHLRGKTYSWYGQVYSVPGVVGIVYGTGNVGKYSKMKDQDVDTFISRDAGKTWSEIAKGAHTYEFGDYGGLVVAVNITDVSNKILFSWNQGTSWKECLLDKTKDPILIDVQNVIMSEPTFGSLQFIIYGSTPDDKGIVYHVDFSNHGLTQCKGIDSPGAADSDFEYFNPYNEHGVACVMGRNVSHLRRKQFAKCYVGVDFNPVQRSTNCPCQEDDWECDFCFKRDKTSNKCVLACKDYNPDAPPIPCSGVYRAHGGYRKIDGNTCDETIGVSYGENRLCPTNNPSSPNKSTGSSSHLVGLVVTLILLLVFAAAIVGFFVARSKSQEFRERSEFIMDFFTDLRSKLRHSYQKLRPEGTSDNSLIDDDDHI